MKKLMIAVMCFAGAGHVLAQEAEGAAPAEEGAVAVADGGVTAVQDAQEAEVAEPAEFKSAEDILREVMTEKGWEEGWDEEKGRMIIVQSEIFTDKDPAKSKDFFLRREMAAKRGALNAKAQMIEAINSKIDAEDKLDIPGRDVGAELSAERDKVFEEVNAKKAALLDLLAKTNKAEADLLEGTTFGMRVDDMMSAIIKKLDSEYDSGKHDAALKARYEELKAQVAKTTAEYNDLVKKAKELDNVQQTQSSFIKSVAKMPIYGATAILQAESWDKSTGEYMVSTVYTWSKALERATRAIVTGEDFKTKPGKLPIGQWLAKQNLATMIGPRQYIDDKGNRWFLGVTARSVEGLPSVKKTKAKGTVEMFAKQMAVFSIFSDVESYKEATAMLETRSDGENEIDVTAEDFGQKISSKCNNKTVRGLQKLTGRELKHPMTGDKIYVAVFGINANSAKAALEIEKLNYATKVLDQRHQTVEKGRDAANAAAVKAATNRADDFQKGAQAQAADIANELKSRQPKPAQPTGITSKVQGSKGSGKTGASAGGAHIGDTDVGDDF